MATIPYTADVRLKDLEEQLTRSSAISVAVDHSSWGGAKRILLGGKDGLAPLTSELDAFGGLFDLADLNRVNNAGTEYKIDITSLMKSAWLKGLNFRPAPKLITDLVPHSRAGDTQTYWCQISDILNLISASLIDSIIITTYSKDLTGDTGVHPGVTWGHLYLIKIGHWVGGMMTVTYNHGGPGAWDDAWTDEVDHKLPAAWRPPASMRSYYTEGGGGSIVSEFYVQTDGTIEVYGFAGLGSFQISYYIP